MKKVILFLMMTFLSLGFVNANVVNDVKTNTYVSRQVVKTIFLNTNNNVWFKSDSLKINIDLKDKNNKIIINEYDFVKEYKLKTPSIIKYENSDVYEMKGVDLYNNKVDIEVIYFKDNNILLTISSDSDIMRYKIIRSC